MIYNYGRFVISIKVEPSGWQVTSGSNETYKMWLYLGKVIKGTLHGFMLTFGPIDIIIGRA